jgi:hypothetical protein
VTAAVADIPFVGGSYEAPMVLQDAQRLINWYVEVSQDQNSKKPLALLGCPGLRTIIAGIDGQVRGCWVLPGGTQALVVIAQNVYVMTVTTPATATSIAQFSTVLVGTLLTTTGPVIIRDNGPLTAGFGGYAVLVDGLYMYYYRLLGAGTFVFTGGLINGSTIISLPATLPQGILISPGATLTDSAGLIQAGSYVVSVDFNTPAVTMSLPALNTIVTDTITLNISAFGRLTDPGLPPFPSRLAFIEGWLIVNNVGSRQFQTNGPTPYTIMWPGSFYALKDSSSDNLVTIYENNRELWAIGERTAEVWVNQGGANFAFARLPGVGPQMGCAAQHSVTRVANQLIWLGRNEQGENIVVMNEGYGWNRVSSHGVEHAISQYPFVSDAIGFAYEEEGHNFYVLTFPTADATWCLDITTLKAAGPGVAWHQRASWDSVAGVYHRFRGNCFMNFADLRIVGDYSSGQIHQMSRQIYTDADRVLRCARRTPHVWNIDKRSRLFFSQVQVEFTPGVGLQFGQGSNPQAMMRWSNDGGFTWSNEHWVSIGQVGLTKYRAIWRMLGSARDRVWELCFSDPTARDIIGATMFAEAEEDFAA